MTHALEGLKVLDLSRVLAGPLLTKYLAEYGATVVRVESEKAMDPLRVSTPFVDMKPGINRSGYYAMWNPNKYCISIDLKKPGSMDLMNRLVRWCDVLVENYAPGVMEKLELGFEQLTKIKPDIIVLSTTNQGQTGPFAKFAGFGYTLTAMSGFTSLTQEDGKAAVNPFNGLTDLVAPPFCGVALLAALEYRRRTGKGQHLDISQYECAVYMLSAPLTEYAVEGTEFKGMGNRSADAAPQGAYPCNGQDQWCVISVEDDKQWQTLCKVIDRPELANDLRFVSFEKRKGNEDILDGILSQWTKQRNATDIMHTFQSAGIAAAPVQSPRDLFNDPQLKYRRHFRPLDHAEMGRHNYEMSPFCLHDTPGELSMPAPCLGEHSILVCKEFLKMSEQEVDQLVMDGTIQ